MNKKLFYMVLFLTVSHFGLTQSSTEYFNQAANQYIYESDQLALNTIDKGLSNFPGDKDLTNLKEKILREKEDQQQQQNQDQEQQQQENQEQEEQQDQEQESEQQEQEQQEQQNQEQESEEGEESEEQQQQPQQPQEQETDEEGEEMEQPPMSRSEKLEELNLTEEKARMILEAMKNNEIQYIQQNQRKPTKKPDSNKPDW